MNTRTVLAAIPTFAQVAIVVGGVTYLIYTSYVVRRVENVCETRLLQPTALTERALPAMQLPRCGGGTR